MDKGVSYLEPELAKLKMKEEKTYTPEIEKALEKAHWEKVLRQESSLDCKFYTKAERIRDILNKVKYNLIYRFFRFLHLVPDIDEIARSIVMVLPLKVLDGYPGQTIDGKDHPDIPDAIYIHFNDRKVGEKNVATLPLVKELKGDGKTQN